MKADGYGHGEVEVAQAALKLGRKWSQSQRRMRRYGSEWRVLVGTSCVMGPSPFPLRVKQLSSILSITVSDADWLQEALTKIQEFEKSVKNSCKN